MKLPVNHSRYAFVTDDSRACGQDTAFLSTQMSRPYEADARARGCAEIIAPQNLHGLLQTRITLIGVCGTNGKTTTAAAIYSMLLDLGVPCALQGTRGFFLNDRLHTPKGLTTPMLLESYAHIDAAVREGCRTFVMEVSSHAIDQERIEGLGFALKVHTNITSDHLDYHKTLEHYVATKRRFFADATPKIINADDPIIRFDPTNSYTYGIEQPAHFSVKAYGLQEGIDAQVAFGSELAFLHSPLHGRHNLYNLLAAVAAVKTLQGETLERVCEVAEQFGGVSGRLERVSQEPLVFIDFAHTEDGMRQVFEAFRHRPISVVFGAGGDRDPTKRPKMGRVAEQYARKVTITSDNPRTESPEAIAGAICSGMQHPERACVILDRREAIAHALQQLEPGEVLLILGKGDETYQEIMGVKHPMSDQQIVLSILGR